MSARMRFLQKAAAIAAVCMVAAPALATTAPKGAMQDGDGPRVTTSKDGRAIVSANNLAPGDRTNGTVVVTNDGDAVGSLVLRASTVSDRPGPAGGNLSETLTLVVTDITRPGKNSVYRGPLRGLEGKTLGRIGAGEARSYRFGLLFREGPSTRVDDAYQSSAVGIDFAWAISS